MSNRILHIILRAALFTSVLAVIILGFFLVKFSMQIPIRSLFRYSSVALVILAVILVG